MIYNLQALRALAASMVVMLHAAALLSFAGVPDSAFTFGGAGVDLFFVISGFVMVYTTERNPLSPAMFLLNRIIRIVPLYWAVTICLFVAWKLVPGAFGHMSASNGALLKSLLFIPFVRFDGGVQPLLFVGWTLDFEMRFYVIFAIALLATGAIRRISLVSLALVAICVTIAILRPASPVLQSLGAPIMLEFAFGMWLALGYIRGFRMTTASAALSVIVGLSVMIGHYFVVGDQWRFLLSGVPSLAIVAGALSLERNGAVVKWRWVQTLGAASYALYLTHPFIVIAGRRLGGMAFSVAGLGGAVLLALATFLAAAVVGVLVHVGFEKPVGRLLRRAMGERPAIAVNAA